MFTVLVLHLPCEMNGNVFFLFFNLSPNFYLKELQNTM